MNSINEKEKLLCFTTGEWIPRDMISLHIEGKDKKRKDKQNKARYNDKNELRYHKSTCIQTHRGAKGIGLCKLHIM